jgi:transcriptional regulator with XRE-family HTH domain
MPSLGETVKKLREERGWSQRDLAAKAMVTDAYIAMIEGGEKQNFSATVIRRLERALGTRHGELARLLQAPE